MNVGGLQRARKREEALKLLGELGPGGCEGVRVERNVVCG